MPRVRNNWSVSREIRCALAAERESQTFFPHLSEQTGNVFPSVPGSLTAIFMLPEIAPPHPAHFLVAVLPSLILFSNVNSSSRHPAQHRTHVSDWVSFAFEASTRVFPCCFFDASPNNRKIIAVKPVTKFSIAWHFYFRHEAVPKIFERLDFRYAWLSGVGCHFRIPKLRQD
jgi:hypothetical protein